MEIDRLKLMCLSVETNVCWNAEYFLMVSKWFIVVKLELERNFFLLIDKSPPVPTNTKSHMFKTKPSRLNERQLIPTPSSNDWF